MIIRQFVSGRWNVIADGYVYGKYFAENYGNGERSILFTVCYSFITDQFSRERKYYSIKCKAYGKGNENFVEVARKNRTRVLVMGISREDPTEDNGTESYVSVWTIIPIGIISKMWEQYLSLISRDKQLEQILQTDYAYVTDEKAEDHMI